MYIYIYIDTHYRCILYIYIYVICVYIYLYIYIYIYIYYRCMYIYIYMWWTRWTRFNAMLGISEFLKNGIAGIDENHHINVRNCWNYLVVDMCLMESPSINWDFQISQGHLSAEKWQGSCQADSHGLSKKSPKIAKKDGIVRFIPTGLLGHFW